MTVIDFASDFDTPFSDSEIVAQSAEGAFPSPVSINGRPYVIDLTQYDRNTLDQQRSTQDTSREPGEQTLSVEGVWKRTGTAAFLGAGQHFYDDEGSDRSRFWRSHGIDPWTRRRVCLLPDTIQVRESINTNIGVLKVGDYLCFHDNDVIYATTTPRSPSTIWTDQDVYDGGTAAPVTSMTTNGTTVYCACAGAGIRKFVPGTPGGVELVADVDFSADLVVYANGWLVAGHENELVSVTADGTVVVIGEHRQPDFAWNCGTSSPGAIYMAGNAGDKAEIYRVSVDETGGALSPPIFAGDLPTGETINTIGYYSGTVLIGTSVGLRIASLGTDGGLSIGTVIEDATGGGVHCLETRGRFVWFGYGNEFDGGARGLARADLSRFVEEFVPAYAADLASTVTSDHTTGVATWVEGTHDYRVFTVAGSGLWVESDELVESGQMDLGLLGQESPEQKSLQSVSVGHEALQGTVLVEVSNENGTTVEASSEVQGGFGSGEVQRPLNGELLNVLITLTHDEADAESGPCLRRWTLRLIPAPAAVEEIICPIIMSDTVTDSGSGELLHYDPYEEFFLLKQLESPHRVVTYREGQASYDVTVRSVRVKGPSDWAKNRRFFNCIIEVRMITLDGVPPRIGGI